MNLQEKTLTELKALAYDLLIQQQNIQVMLNAIYAEIEKRHQNDTRTDREEA
mgnify:CR=1 FL=1